ncbi:hypothetical protein [Dyella silvatica]|uniref:phage nozzle protein n=1 Tax=Dyella silvatica TaxID=2992128 RepID=UPI00224DCF0C|nr:hypothetical protein [Dyella silvatica]
MPLISGTIPSLIGGVSQQDASVRQPAQFEEGLNLDLSPASGAGPRAPARFINVLGSDIPDDAFFHSIVRDAREKYLVVIYEGRVRVFNHVTGKEHVVVMDEASRPYLNTIYAPHESIRATTIEDYTILVNREVVVAMATDVAPNGTPINMGNSGQTPTGPFGPLMNPTLASVPVSGSVQTFQDLPKDGAFGQIWEIRGDGASGFTGYYVQREATKVWREVAKPGIPNTFNRATMPHGLKRIPDSITPDGFYFSYGPLDYDKRYAGNERTCPVPSLVGQRIGNVLYHRDRLVLLAGENVLMSEVGHYVNFWRTTVTALLDSDTIDVAMPTEGVAELTHGVPYQKALLLFASGTVPMMQLTGDPVLSPKTVKVDPVTTYQVSPTIKPVVAGSSVFFVDDTTNKTWATIREYFVSSDVITPEAANITAHVPAFVPGKTRCMTAVPDADLVLLSHRSPNGPQVYVHQFKWVADQKQQSAWHPWKIEGVGEVVHLRAIGTDLYLIAKAPGGVEMLTMDLSPAPTFPAVTPEFDIYLDRRELVKPVWQMFGNYTDVTVPFVMPTLTNLAVLKTTDWSEPGAYLDITQATLVNGGQTLRLPGNVAQGRVVIGYKYKRRVTLSQQFVREQNGNTKTIGRLQMRRMTVRFARAAYFRCLVYPKGRTEAIDTLVPQLMHTYTARTAGDAEFLLNVPKLSSGTHTFLVASRADHVHVALDSDSPYPCWWQSVQWEALYITKVRQ